MPRKRDKPEEPTPLRRRAEGRANERRGDQQSDSGTLRLLQELEIRQIELEMQNAAHLQARADFEVALKKYTDMYDFAPVAYLTLDHEGIIREANLAGARLLGIEQRALANQPIGPFVSAGDLPAFRAFLQKVLASKVRLGCEVTLQVEGKPPIDVGIDGIAFGSGRAGRMVLTIITERRWAEGERLIRNKLESTGILAGGIAHDFNNLLTAIFLNLELAQKLSPPGAGLARHLEEAKQASLLAQALAAQLITFAEGGAPLPKAIALPQVIQESVQPALRGSKVRCEFSLAEDLWFVEADAGQIGQVIRNMVLNAREAMPQGGVVFVRAENVVRGAQEQPSLSAGEYVRISIADRGTGIAKDVLQKIFDPYFSTKQRGQQKGMGLGLTISHAVVQKHQGAIAVESVVGVGTTFHIYLPAARELRREEKAPVPRDDPGRLRILVMDDDVAVRTIVELTLRQLGHEVELAEDGQTAVEIYGMAKGLGRPFDAVIMDLTVPGRMGGKGAVQALLRIDPTVKAIVMSGYADDPILLEPDRYGFRAALAKPFTLEQLREVLARLWELERTA
ncbi:MAG: ATP-binding protein [Verrucomicrobiales bacterium]|nr:ATP-binding protein [Verrucomicrobiales bacterium]